MIQGKSHKDLYFGGICLITDKASCMLTVFEMARLALESGIKWIQYRDKSKDRLDVFRNAMALREITREFGACLIINDHADIAVAVGADGVHLGQEDLPASVARRVMGKSMIIGISTHSIDEAVMAEAEGADYIGFGPVYYTKTKDVGPPRGLDALRKIKDSVGIPVVAIGGINIENCESVLESGASAVATASSVLSGDVYRNACCLVDLMGKFARSV